MPANLTPDYRLAENRFRAAETLEDKLAALEDMLATIPKHKGTEKMQADIKRRISRIRDTILQGQKAGTRPRNTYTVKREGAGQVALVGPANSGKSSILAALSNAEPEIADYPFTTQVPQPGMVAWENANVQVVDLPPFDPELSPQWLSGVIRSTDAAAIVFSLASDDLLDEVEKTFDFLSRQKTWLRPGSPPAAESTRDLRPTATGLAPLAGPEAPEGEGPKLPGEARAAEGGAAGSGAVESSAGRATRATREDKSPPAVRRWPAIVVANKLDAPGAADRLEMLKEVCPALPIIAISATEGWGLDELRAWLFGLLEKVRVYTKAPGHKVDKSAPFVIPRGATLLDAAAAVHKDFAENLKSAKVWGRNTFDGQLVPKDYVIEDEDVVELRI